ncbi:SRPBCC family protein [Flagellimonas pelagia]|uniref:Cell division inhibitor n=1 Tax=Flagellimonas pelagia TaxID=2306998 RepID=A0A3A1NMP5_9FLAO|nr:SRPBCC family protein [Allomuricauda maritima]RIV45974.1 cell division inhibitor [Allomuricauda maritima]TXJ98739.1 SRPBCC family protein [Allomuricauda maritima]
MKLYQLHAKQALPISKKEAWEFLSNPRNLKTITPKHMGFDILSGANKNMYPGQIIQYRVKPFPFFNTKWVTEITHVRDGDYFVDEQRFGPYALWHHKHFLKEIPGGVEMEDVVDYKIPFGFLGSLAQTLFIKKQLETIFLFRERKLNEIFGKVDENSSTLNFKSI